MPFHTVYDIASSPFEGWIFLVFGCATSLLLLSTRGLFGIGGGTLLTSPVFFNTDLRRLVLLVVAIGAIAATIVAGSGYILARYAIYSGHYRVVTGSISQFSPARSGSYQESFTVGRKTFYYSDSDVGPGFHETIMAGGLVKEGEIVRVSYVGNYILRLEVKSGV